MFEGSWQETLVGLGFLLVGSHKHDIPGTQRESMFVSEFEPMGSRSQAEIQSLNYTDSY